MFGKIRNCSSTSLESLETQRLHSKILKDDSLSIYESTLAKLKLGSQRKLNPISNELGVIIDNVSVSMSTDSESTKKIDSNCSFASSSHSHNGDAMSIDTACDSPTKQSSSKERERDAKLVSIAYLFSKFKNPHLRRVVSSNFEVDSVSSLENVCSVGDSPPTFSKLRFS